MKFASKLIHGGQCTHAINLWGPAEEYVTNNNHVPHVLRNVLGVLRNVR